MASNYGALVCFNVFVEGLFIDIVFSDLKLSRLIYVEQP